MSAGPLSVPGAKATLVLSVTLSILGLGGVMWSWAFLEYAPGTEMSSEGALLPSENREAAAALMDVMVRSPVRRGLAVANLLVSALLVVASFMLMLRRPSGLWWAKQALLGNLLYTPIAVVGSVWFYATNETTTREIMMRLTEAQGTELAGGAEPSAMGLAVGDLCLGTVMIGVYLSLLRMTRRGDVRAFMGEVTDR